MTLKMLKEMIEKINFPEDTNTNVNGMECIENKVTDYKENTETITYNIKFN